MRAACRRRSSVAHQKSLKFRVVRLFRKEPSFIKAESGGGSMHVRMKVDFVRPYLGLSRSLPHHFKTHSNLYQIWLWNKTLKLAEAESSNRQILNR